MRRFDGLANLSPMSLHANVVRPAGWMAARSAKLLGPLEPHRVMLEAAALAATLPGLLTAPTAGDGHPVLVVPGVSGGAGWCAALRAYLRHLGHNVHQPAAWATKGRPRTVVHRLVDQVAELSRVHGDDVSIIGWSVGGALVRQAALLSPEPLRRVITLGAPVSGLWYRDVFGTGARAMPVPTSAIYSKTDPVFHWRTCAQYRSPRCEDIVIPSSHMGMATNVYAYHAIADRLAQPAGSWTLYRPPRNLPVRATPARGRVR
ncbi:MAG: hypothetical protein V9G19_16320 [Tetrasphaera sp.]